MQSTGKMTLTAFKFGGPTSYYSHMFCEIGNTDFILIYDPFGYVIMSANGILMWLIYFVIIFKSLN